MMLYIEIVGLDGAGKSRLSRSLVREFGDCARRIHVSQSKIMRDAVRRVTTGDNISPLTRAMVYMSAHSEVYDSIASDLERIDYLIGDRGYACFHAYQYQCPAEVIDQLWSIAMRGLYPDLLVFLDTPVWLCQERIARRGNPSEMDRKPASFHCDVRERYLAFIQSYHYGQTLILDGTKRAELLCVEVQKALNSLI